MTALLSSKNFSLNYSRFTPCHWISLERRRLKGNQYWKTLEMLCSSLEVSERLQLGNTAYFFKYTTEFWKIQSPEEQTLQHFLKLNCQKKNKKQKLSSSIRWQGIGDLGRRSLGILKYQIFLLLQKVFTSFFQPDFGVNEISLTLSVSVRERSLGEVSTSLKSVSPTLIASEAFQRYFQTTLNAMAQKCWVKGKMAKIPYVPSHFLLFFFLPGVWKIGISETTDSEVSCWEKSRSTPFPHPSPSLQKAILRVHLENTCSVPGIGCTRSRVLGGVRLGGCQPFHPWFQGLRRQSKPNPLSTPCLCCSFFPPFEFPLPFLFSFFLETNQNPHHQVSSMLIRKCPTDRERFEPLSDRPGRPQTSLGLGGLTWVCCCFITPGAAVAFVGSSVLRVVFHSSFLSLWETFGGDLVWVAKGKGFCW